MQEDNNKSISKQSQTVNSKKEKFKINRKHLQGFLDGILVTVILFTGIMAGINPDFFKGTFTKQIGSIAFENEIDNLEVIASPTIINATTSFNTSFTLDIPVNKLNNIKADEIYLWGFFDGMKVSEVSSENGKLKINIEGTPKNINAYDSDTSNDNGYISIFGDAVKDKEIGYTATVNVTYPRFTSNPERLETNNSYDTDVSLTLTGDNFIKTPSFEDISLDGIFTDMELSNIKQNGNVLSFHIKGNSSDSGYNGHIGISKNVLASGFNAEKIILIDGAPSLYSITPITVETPFEDTLVLRVSNDFFTETITPEMFTLGGGLQNASISKVEYIDNMSVYITLCGHEVREIGSGTITVSNSGLQSGRTVTATIPIKAPSISMKCGDEKILASANNIEKEYKLTVFSEGNDFVPYLTFSDFVLKDALSNMQITGVKWLNGYKIELTLKGVPTVGSGVISLRSGALGGVTGADCSINVTETVDFYGQVNLAKGLSEMVVSFCNKDGNTLNIPTVTTESDGSFIVTVTSDIPVDSIAFIKAKNNTMELRSPFHWDERESLNINAFTTLMWDTITKSTTEKEGIQKVYKYLELADLGLSSTNFNLQGKNTIFSHSLFETQANGDVNGYIKQLEEEIQNGKTRSFVQTNDLNGETGGFLDKIIDWGIDKVKDIAVSGIKAAIIEGSKTGLIYLLREAGILGPSTEEMLEELQASVNALSAQVQNMQEQLTQEIKEAELQGMMNNLAVQLTKITSLTRQYNGRKALIDNEVAAYRENPTIELSSSKAFFGTDGVIAKADLYNCITNIIDILNASHVGKSLISVYFDVLKGRLPFEQNAGEELCYFIKYVTAIETTGLELYSAYCLFSEDPNLEADLNTLTEIYEESIDAQLYGFDGKPALLPDKKIFSVSTEHGPGTTTVRCNYNGKYYTIPDKSAKIKDEFIKYLDFYSGIYGYKNYSERKNMTTQDFDDLFHYRELYYKNMSHTDYLVQFGEIQNIPDWLVYDVSKGFVWFFSAVDQQITFYDMSDNVYRTYYASNLYKEYGDWYAKEIFVYNW